MNDAPPECAKCGEVINGQWYGSYYHPGCYNDPRECHPRTRGRL
jgi:hypothetical protein